MSLSSHEAATRSTGGPGRQGRRHQLLQGGVRARGALVWLHNQIREWGRAWFGRLTTPAPPFDRLRPQIVHLSGAYPLQSGDVLEALASSSDPGTCLDRMTLGCGRRVRPWSAPQVARTIAWTLCVDGPVRLRLGHAFASFVTGDAVGNLTPFGPLASEGTKAVFVRPHLPTLAAHVDVCVPMDRQGKSRSASI